ncbi:UDP-N-acetylglucosamine--N-acetylmuramyl-(pentapeptide) pyrophosphoryl-undecaprenol N-acetylglucosamine transferase, partial [Aduncisulcus paluster]
LMLVALFGFIVIRTLTRAYATEDMFSRFAASGLAILFGVQATINMAVNLQLIPAKGMTLPFISYGGSSFVSLAYGVGMMLALTRQRPRTEIESMEGASAQRAYARGLRVRLATDGRALRYSGLFGKESIELVPSATVRSRNPISLAQTVLMLGYGTLVAANVMRRLKPAAVVGFGGYPTLPPLVAARMLGVPGIIHDANAATTVGTPMRPAILAAAAVKYTPPEVNGPLRLLVVGGSQGARVMSDIVPPAIEQLDPALWSRLIVTQQVREEDMERVRAVYDRLKINAELAPFFADLPARLASSQLVISRSGAGTVAELAA